MKARGQKSRAFVSLNKNLKELCRVPDIKLTLVVESVNPVDGRTLVISAQQEKVLRILYLKRGGEFSLIGIWHLRDKIWGEKTLLAMKFTAA